jgi:exoribonuclease-2
MEVARPGAIVAWWNGAELAFGLVAGEEKQRVRLVLSGGREERVRPSRLVVEVARCERLAEETVEARRGAGERVRRVEAELRERAAAIDVALLWEIVRDTADPDRAWDAPELAELSLGASGGEFRAVVMLALLTDAIHFLRRGDGWQPRKEDAVRGLLLQRESLARRESEKREFLQAIRAAAEGEPYHATGSEQERRYLDALERLAVHEDDIPDAARATALEALGASRVRFDRAHEGAFRLLRAVGRFTHDDQNLQILRYGLRTEFPREVLAPGPPAILGSAGERRDLTGLAGFSIDSPQTREVDDVLSLERIDTGFRLGVHIADPGAFIAPGDPVDLEAETRGLTVYFADTRLTMLPAAISEDAASLSVDRKRPALSFLADLTRDGSLAGYEIVRSWVRCSRRFSYTEADRSLGDGSAPVELAWLDDLAAGRRAQRVSSGALILDTDDVDPHLDGDGEPCLDRLPGDSPSRRAVTEAMILAGEIAAGFCVSEQVPMIYRRQAAPRDPLDVQGVVDDPVAAHRARRRLRRGEAGVEPAPHFALGLDSYCQVTSPLRRFQDLANQRQISARVAGLPLPYDEPALRRVGAVTERAVADARRAESAARSYWFLRYLERRRGEVVDAVVLETGPKLLVRLETTQSQHLVTRADGIRAGDRLRLRVERVHPRAGLLSLQRVAEPG